MSRMCLVKLRRLNMLDCERIDLCCRGFNTEPGFGTQKKKLNAGGAKSASGGLKQKCKNVPINAKKISKKGGASEKFALTSNAKVPNIPAKSGGEMANKYMPTRMR